MNDFIHLLQTIALLVGVLCLTVQKQNTDKLRERIDKLEQVRMAIQG